MTKHPLLIENESKRLTLPLPMLLCVAMFTVWQMGVMFFSGDALSVGGRTPFSPKLWTGNGKTSDTDQCCYE